MANAKPAKPECKKKPRGKPFVPGGKGGPGRGHKSAPKAMGNAAEDMRRAYEEVESPSDPQGVKAARRLLKENYEKFMTLYSRVVATPGAVEAEEEKAREALTAAAGPKEAKVEALIQQLLEEWEAEDERSEGAKRGRGPGVERQGEVSTGTLQGA